MGRALRLECFDTVAVSGAAATLVTEDLREEERLHAFDNGYKAGWDDAAKAYTDEQASISSELGKNLQLLSFSYHEARDAILSEMEGLLRGIITKILPATLRSTLGETIFERLAEIAEQEADVPVEIVVCPENAGRVRDLVTGRVAPPLTILEEPTLGSGQAFIRFGRSETKVDLDAALRDMSDAIKDFFETSEHEEDTRHA